MAKKKAVAIATSIPVIVPCKDYDKRDGVAWTWEGDSINGRPITVMRVLESKKDALIKSLESSLGVGSKGGFFSGLVIVIIVAGLVILLIISAIVGFFRRMLGLAPRSSASPTPAYQEAQPQRAYNRGDYGDGRDNFGSGAAGDF